MLGEADSYCFGGVWAIPTPVCHGRYIMSVMKVQLFGAADSYCFGGVWATPTPVCHDRYIMSVKKDTSCLEKQILIVLVVFGRHLHQCVTIGTL